MISPGARVGKYEVKRLLGQGGFGMVFAAHDTKLDRECAMKFLLPEHTSRPEILQRFLKEARSAAKIKHPGIVTVFECDVVEGAGAGLDGMAFIAMELLEGESLSDRLRRGPLPIDQAIEISRQVASALAAAHAVGIIHRDLKPDNIFLVPDPATMLGERVKVLDFGIAKLADDAGTAGGVKTSTHMIFGTPKYMSPEQCKSTAKVDERSDIYALGCILFEMVTGRAPFEGDAGELIAMQQLAQPPTAKSLRADLPEPLDAAISAMLAKQPTLRPSTMTDIVKQLGTSPPTPTRAAEVRVAEPTPVPMTPSEPPMVPTSPPLGIEKVSPTVAVARPELLVQPPKRSRIPFVALAGVAIVGGTVAIIALGGGSRPAATSSSGSDRGSSEPGSQVAIVDAALVPPPVDAYVLPPEQPARYYELYVEYFDKAAALARDGKCSELAPMIDEVREKSALLAENLEDLRCGSGTHQRRRASADKIYAMPASGSTLGSSEPKVTLVFGFEFQSASSKRAHEIVDRLLKKYSSHVQVFYTTSVVHPKTMPASVGACAASHQRGWWFGEDVAAPSCDKTPDACPLLVRRAVQRGMNGQEFTVASRTCFEVLTTSIYNWHRFHVTTAPAFAINGRLFVGEQSYDALANVIDEEIAKANSRIASGMNAQTLYAKWIMTDGREQLDPDDTTTETPPFDDKAGAASLAAIDIVSCKRREKQGGDRVGVVNLKVTFDSSGQMTDYDIPNADNIFDPAERNCMLGRLAKVQGVAPFSGPKKTIYRRVSVPPRGEPD